MYSFSTEVLKFKDINQFSTKLEKTFAQNYKSAFLLIWCTLLWME